MNKSIKNKISSLIAVDRRDSSIFTPFNTNHLSISNFVNLEELFAFFDGITDQIMINSSVDFEDIEQELNDCESVTEFLNVCEKISFPLPTSKLNLLNANFNKSKNEVISLVVKYLSNLKTKFLSLQRSALQILKNSGSWNLYLTRYFLKGLTPIKYQSIKAPIILIQVEIIEENGNLFIRRKEEKELNQKLIVFLQREVNKNNKLISEYEKTIKDIMDLKKDLEEIVNLKFSIIRKNEDLRFVKETSTNVASNYKELFIEDSVCLGIFEPGGGNLKNDLEHIVNSDSFKDIFESPPKTSIEQIKNEETDNLPIIQIDKLDVYQRYAVRSSLKDNTVIFGPPGTGKSEVISNIIANILFNDKDVMMVSEKAAALEVLKKRMKSLNIFMLLIYDINNKKDFFESIQKLAKFLGNSWLVNNVDIYKNAIKEQKINGTLSEAKNFKEIIQKFEELKKFKHNNQTFIDFINEVEKIGNFKTLLELKNLDIVFKIENFISDNNLSKNNFFKLLKDYVAFVDNENISKVDDYKIFLHNANNLKASFNKYNFDISNNSFIETELKKIDDLNNFLNSNFNYQKILKNNPFKFYEDVESYKKFKNNCIGLISQNFFDKINEAILKIRPFFNIFSSAKDSDKKYILDTFKSTLEIVSKKPLSKIFGSSKLNNEDNKILQELKNLDNLNLQDYSDFNFIFQNQDLFNPLLVLYFFDKNIANEKYIKFIKNQFYLFDLNFYEVQKKFNLTLEKFNLIKDLFSNFSVYQNNFPEFTSNELFINFINKFKTINWNNICDLLTDIIREKILIKLSKLSSEDKKFVETAINVAHSSKSKEIYEYLSKYANALKKLFPIWVSRPEQVSIFIPLEKNYFEYGIYDEASQMFLERAYPLLFRSKINIIAGDNKQLKPSSFFISRNEENDEEIEIDDLDIQESLLDRAKTTSWTEIMLQNHYRSENSDLIKFSSEFIYENKLNFASKNGLHFQKGIEVINCDGFFVDRINEKEALETIKILEENVNKYKSILIITFNIAQSSYIESLLMNQKYSTKEVMDKFMKQEIDVTNLENVQGNEADLVIISIAYAKKSVNEKLRSAFGPIIQSGGKNRLNVAITRSKNKMIILKSLSASEIVDNTNENLQIFKKFIAFLDNIALLDKANQVIKNDNFHFDSSFEEEVFEELKPYVYENNLRLLTQFEVGNKKIDIVITDIDCEKVYLGIEVDGWKYHSGKIKVLEDFERQLFLESRGYPIFRVLEHEWKRNKELIIENIFKEVLKNKEIL